MKVRSGSTARSSHAAQAPGTPPAEEARCGGWNLTLTALAIAALVQTALGAGKCGSQNCGKDSPCCVRGYCNSDAMYCMPFNCEAANSYSESSCWDTAHCVQANLNFGSGNAFAQIADYKGDPAKTAFVSQFEPSHAKQDNGELVMELVKQSDGKGFGATVINTRAIQYGTVSTVMRSGSTSGGVVSSFIIRNDRVGDEIDFEFVGGDRSTVQSNYYWHDQLDYTKMIKSPVLPDTTSNYHTYAIQWTPDKIVWLVNGNAFRTVSRAETWDKASNTFKFPDAEAYISYSIWDGGSGAKGTSDWAGGAINWGSGPFNMAVKSISIDCYYKGNETTYTPPNSGKDDEDKTSDEEDSESSTVKSATSKTDSAKTSKTAKPTSGSSAADEDEDTEDGDEDVGEQGDSDEVVGGGTIQAGTVFAPVVKSSTSNGRALAVSAGAIASALVAACLF
ncbi:putative glycosidase CRH2 [Coemansia sp. Benny D115]|nr:putative glycosidase CRH2 [Coemansia sp. Benny D115]